MNQPTPKPEEEREIDAALLELEAWHRRALNERRRRERQFIAAKLFRYHERRAGQNTHTGHLDRLRLPLPPAC